MEPLMHWIIPTVTLLAFFPKINRKTVIILSTLTQVPDLDILIPGMHRVLTSNIFFVLIIFGILYKFLGKEKAYIGLYFMGSHLLFDLGYPGIAIFWPLIMSFYYLEFNINGNGGLNFDFDFGNLPVAEGFDINYGYAETRGFLIFLLLIFTLALFWWIYKRKK